MRPWNIAHRGGASLPENTLPVFSDAIARGADGAEGEGEVFMIGRTQKLVAGNFIVFPSGVEHDIYAHGAVALRLLSFFPTTEILSTFQQVVFPIGSNVLSSIPPKSVVTELDPETLPQDFPFELDELGLADSGTGEEPAQGSAEEAGPDSE